MSGHSKWSGIKHKKMLIDTKRGKIFNKLIRDIVIAVKEGGSKIESNARLKKAIANAKEYNMPQDNIKNAIQRSIRDLNTTQFEDVCYEGYGPFGIAVIIEVLTNNKNRTASELRKIFSKYHGNLGHNGCVSWLFDKKACILIDQTIIDENKLIDIVLNTNINNDFNIELINHMYELLIPLNELNNVKQTLLTNNIDIHQNSIKMIPKIKVTGKNDGDIELFEAFLHALNEYEDVTNIHTNFSTL
ncbi:MAG: YebC/PmpR family DNA-binding transcriptional regulator [Endomicrobium sp.]|jgi:YebC/PmpR family DNA-binding regulatory protein|nr:YebC/PmpR family DNA-binding transcriptional regulator [Endomicrobium sp.]